MRIAVKNFGSVLIALLALEIFGISRCAGAEEALRWRFKIGDKLHFIMVQDMKMDATAGALPEMKSSMHQVFDITWDVQGVDEASGEAVIRWKFDRVQMKLTTPQIRLNYDSKSEEPPSGLAAEIAPLYKAMTESDFEVTMTARGEVKDVKMPEPFFAALKNSRAAQLLGEMATPDGVKKMLSQGALVLPNDPPKPGDSWEAKVQIKNRAGGLQTIATAYRYEGSKEIDGLKYAVIRPQLKISFENKPQAQPPGQPPQSGQQQLKMKEQRSDGEVLFDIKEGRLSSSSLKSNLTIDVTEDGQTTQQRIEQKIEVKATPAGAKKSAAPKKPESGSEKAKS